MKKILLLLFLLVFLFYGKITEAQSYYRGIFLPAGEASFWYSADRPDGSSIRVHKEVVDGGATTGNRGGDTEVLRMEYNLDGTSWDSVVQWETVWPADAGGALYSAYVVWSGEDPGVTTVPGNVFRGSICVTLTKNKVVGSGWCSSTFRFPVETDPTVWNSYCDLDGASCTTSASCTGSTNYCFTNTFITGPGTTRAIVQDITAATQSPCTGSSCNGEPITVLLKLPAPPTTAGTDFRVHGVLLIYKLVIK